MRDRVRDRVNVSIDHDIKRMFEDLAEVHCREWSEIMEEKALEVIMSADPVAALKYQIRMGEEKNEEMRRTLIKAESMIPELKESSQGLDMELEKFREEKFRKHEESILRLSRLPGGININWWINEGHFNSEKEGKEWLRRRLRKLNNDLHVDDKL